MTTKRFPLLLSACLLATLAVATPPAAAQVEPEPNAPQSVSGRSFRKVVLRADVPVVVEFWAPWCGPCRKVRPQLEAFAKKHAGRVVVATVNIDNNLYLSARYGIELIPTILLFRDGKSIERLRGLPRTEVLERKLGLVRPGEALAATDGPQAPQEPASAGGALR